MNYRTKFKSSGDIWFQIPALILWTLVVTLSFGNYNGPLYSIQSTMNLIGVIQFIVGLTTMILAQYTLGYNYSSFLVIREDHKLIKHGLYKYVRHPVYTGGIIAAFAIPVFTSSVQGFLVLLLIIPVLFYRMGIEENMLIEEFGDECREYMENTSRLIPFLY